MERYQLFFLCLILHPFFGDTLQPHCPTHPQSRPTSNTLSDTPPCNRPANSAIAHPTPQRTSRKGEKKVAQAFWKSHGALTKIILHLTFESLGFGMYKLQDLQAVECAHLGQGVGFPQSLRKSPRWKGSEKWNSRGLCTWKLQERHQQKRLKRERFWPTKLPSSMPFAWICFLRYELANWI